MYGRESNGIAVGGKKTVQLEPVSFVYPIHLM